MHAKHVIRRLALGAALAATLAGCNFSGPPTFTVHPETLPNATAGQAYEVEITATYPDGGEVGLKSLSTTGNFPPGLALRSTPSSGGPAAIFGTPTAAGTYAFKLTVGGEYCTMAGCPSGSREYTLVVAP